jgi:hypothetical protein
MHNLPPEFEVEHASQPHARGFDFGILIPNNANDYKCNFLQLQVIAQKRLSIFWITSSYFVMINW